MHWLVKLCERILHLCKYTVSQWQLYNLLSWQLSGRRWSSRAVYIVLKQNAALCDSWSWNCHFVRISCPADRCYYLILNIQLCRLSLTQATIPSRFKNTHHRHDSREKPQDPAWKTINLKTTSTLTADLLHSHLYEWSTSGGSNCHKSTIPLQFAYQCAVWHHFCLQLQSSQ